MLIAIAIYLSGQRYLPQDPRRTRAQSKTAPDPMDRGAWLAFAAVVGLVPVLALSLIPNQEIFNAYLLWGDKAFKLTFFGTRLPTTWLITLDAIVSVSFLAIVALFYRWYGTRWREPDEVTKIVIGSAFSIAGMLCLYAAAATPGADGKIGMFWPVSFHVLNSIAFAHIMPVSLALFARIAPRQVAATVVGMYSMATFLANAAVGWLGGVFQTMPTTTFWLMHVGFAAVAGLIFFAAKLFMLRQGAPAASEPAIA